jgi:hypothetical protein
MPDLSNNNSFIPKRGPVNKKRQGPASRPVYVFTIVSYILMFSTLIATGGVYFYGKVVDKQLNNEIAALNTEISSFSESEMQRVLEFDLRLTQASNRLNNSVSVASVFEALEDATIATVKVAALDLIRENDERFILSAEIETDSFDSTIFQRGVYQRNQTISEVNISALQNGSAFSLADGEPVEQNTSGALVTFIAELNVPLSSVPYVANPVPETQLPIIITEPTGEVPESVLEGESQAEDLGEEEPALDSAAVNNENI